MNKHCYKVLEFDKLREEVGAFAVTSFVYEKIINMEPIKDTSALIRELEVTRDFTDFIKYDGGLDVQPIVDVCTLIKKVSLIGNYLDGEELWHLNHNLRLYRIFKRRLDELDKYKNLVQRFNGVPNLKHVEEFIDKIVDNEKNIKDDASLDLREIRNHRKIIGQTIKQKFDDIFNNPTYSNAIQDKIVTVRDGRTVVAVKSDFKGIIKGVEHDRSASGQTVFIEPLAIVSLNNKVRELEVRERDEIRKILLKMAGIIRENFADIERVGEAVLELDFLNSKASYAIKRKANIPNINTKEILSLVEAKHPLIDEKVVVPLTFEIGKNYNTLLITGPNTGGKTVALKTAGLITLMALSGLPVTADEHTSVGVFTGIFADIGDEQSIEQNLSSFSGHLKNIKEILGNVTKNSLVLLDELGSGTDPVEGAAFAMAVIDYLKEKKAKSFITTHYSEVKAHGYNDELIETASMEFNVETLSPTYRILMGIPGESNALTIAKRIGIPEEIIEVAKNYIGDENKKVDQMVLNIKNKTEELEALKLEVATLREEAEKKNIDYSQKLAVLEKEKNDILKESYDKAEKMLSDIQAKAIGLIEKIQKEENKKSDLKEIQKQLGQIRTNVIEEKKEKIVPVKKAEIKIDFKVGDRVFVKSLNQYASVLQIKPAKETAIIQSGILKMELPLVDMKLEAKDKTKTFTHVGVGGRSAVRHEIDLRGKMVDEAIIEVESYLDRAMISGYNEVHVIHGNGTGALRTGILKYLKTCRYVKDFRMGGAGEGGAGCTVVTLK